MTGALFPDRDRISASAWFLGERLDLRSFERSDALSLSPVTVRTGRIGLAILFRYGVAVLFEVDPVERAAFLEQIAGVVRQPFERPESELGAIRIDPAAEEAIDADGTVLLRAPTLERLQIVAHILAKSAVLAHYEREVAAVLDRVDPLADRLQRTGRSGVAPSDLLREIGTALVTQLRTVGRAEVTESPEMTWDEPVLARLFARLSEEYDLRERDQILERKLELVSSVAETFLDLIHNRRSLRVEWYIVALIAFETGVVLYDVVFRH